ncbi:MAG: hypothetical protein GKS05_03545 [Nitrospirales bacterium]|nr:hypothetical protein [Nitrospirales bacterium]
MTLNLNHMNDQACVGIPALVVSGFLGAGKTTLVRGVLEHAQQTGLRVAVISNEFGALGIDQALLGSLNDDGYVELEGGCVCCKLSDALLETLQDIWERVQPDRIVVETSGVALPFDTMLNFWREPVSEWVGDVVAVVVVNAEQLVNGNDLEGTFEQQVSSADLLLLNKCDVLSDEALPQLDHALNIMAPGTPIIHTVNAHVDIDVLFPPNPGSQDRSRVHQTQHHHHHEHEAFESEELVIEPGISSEQLMNQMRQLKALRLKGFVQTTDGVQLLQGVGPRVDVMPPPCPPPSDLIGRVVVIRRSHQPNVIHEISKNEMRDLSER